MVKLILTFFLFFEIWQIFWCYKRVQPPDRTHISRNYKKRCTTIFGFQLFNVLFIKVGGARPVTGLTVQ